jgi:ubiquinol oxidase
MTMTMTFISNGSIVSAFSSTGIVTKISIQNNHQPTRNSSPNLLRMSAVNEDVHTAATTTLSSPLSPSSSMTMTTPASGIDQNIYTINKVLIDTVYSIICFLYPVRGTERDFARFYVLETVARVPYFAYLSVLHLRETFGERYEGMSERMRTHYAEADNELHHLLIMEELGGNANVIDRIVAQTAAFVYYWYIVLIYSMSEPAAYHLSELIEDHAYNTYNKVRNC